MGLWDTIAGWFGSNDSTPGIGPWANGSGYTTASGYNPSDYGNLTMPVDNSPSWYQGPVGTAAVQAIPGIYGSIMGGIAGKDQAKAQQQAAAEQYQQQLALMELKHKYDMELKGMGGGGAAIPRHPEIVTNAYQASAGLAQNKGQLQAEALDRLVARMQAGLGGRGG